MRRTRASSLIQREPPTSLPRAWAGSRRPRAGVGRRVFGRGEKREEVRETEARGPRHHQRHAGSARAPRALGRKEPGQAAAPSNTARRPAQSSSQPRPRSAAPRIRLLAGAQPLKAQGRTGPGPRARRGRGWLPGTPRWWPPRGWGARGRDGEGAGGGSAGSAEGPGPAPPSIRAAPTCRRSAAARLCPPGCRGDSELRPLAPHVPRASPPPGTAPARPARTPRRAGGRPELPTAPELSRGGGTPTPTVTPTARTRAGEGGAPSRPASPAPPARPGRPPGLAPAPGLHPDPVGLPPPRSALGRSGVPPQAPLESPPQPSLGFLPGWGVGRAPRAAGGIVDTPVNLSELPFPHVAPRPARPDKGGAAPLRRPEPGRGGVGRQSRGAPHPHTPTLAHGGGRIPAGPK